MGCPHPKMSEEVLTWVSDQLHEVMGFSERTMSEFVLALASTSKGQADFMQKLKAAGATMNSNTDRFAMDLLARVPKDVSSTPGRRSQQSNADLLRVSRNYDLVESEGDSDSGAERRRERKKKKKKRKGKEREKHRKKQRKLHARTNADESSEEDTVIRRPADERAAKRMQAGETQEEVDQRCPPPLHTHTHKHTHTMHTHKQTQTCICTGLFQIFHIGAHSSRSSRSACSRAKSNICEAGWPLSASRSGRSPRWKFCHPTIQVGAMWWVKKS